MSLDVSFHALVVASGGLDDEAPFRLVHELTLPAVEAADGMDVDARCKMRIEERTGEGSGLLLGGDGGEDDEVRHTGVEVEKRISQGLNARARVALRKAKAKANTGDGEKQEQVQLRRFWTCGPE